MNDGFSHPIMARDVCISEGIAEDHTHVVELKALDYANQLKRRVSARKNVRLLGLT